MINLIINQGSPILALFMIALIVFVVYLLNKNSKK